MSELGEVLRAYYEATGCDAAVWRRDGADETPLKFISGTRHEAPPPESLLPPLGVIRDEPTERGRLVIVSVPGPRPAWLVLGPCPIERREIDRYLKFLRPVVAQYLQNTLEVEHAANELAERYEEINLLYSISEILGRTVSLGEGASIILREVSETVGARRASILMHDRNANALVVVAQLGGDGSPVPPIALDDECSVSAHVFRTLHSMIAEEGQMPCDAESPFRRGAMLSVPIVWTTQDGAEPIGVVNLSDRRSGQAFTAGDQKLMTAIASQIGAAIQNAQLVQQSLDQQRLQQEMQLAHDQEEAPPRRGARAARGARGRAGRARRRRRWRLLQPVSVVREPDRRHDRRRKWARLSGRPHHGAHQERLGHPRAGHRRSR
jgi:sigma-B regulation protein RsbU (phosphoserine phosphatase)